MKSKWRQQEERKIRLKVLLLISVSVTVLLVVFIFREPLKEYTHVFEFIDALALTALCINYWYYGKKIREIDEAK